MSRRDGGSCGLASVTMTLLIATLAPSWGAAQEPSEEVAVEADLLQQRLAEPWRLDLTLSLSGQEGNSDTSGLGLHVEYLKRLKKGSFGASGKGNLATFENETVAESYNLEILLSRELSTLTSLTFFELFYRDRFKGFNVQNTLGFGVQRVWSAQENWLFETVLGASWRHEELATSGTSMDLADDDYAAATVALQAEEALSESAHFRQKAFVHLPIDNSDNYAVDIALSLHAFITKTLGLTLGGDFRYDNEPLTTAGTTDVRYHAGITVKLSAKREKAPEGQR